MKKYVDKDGLAYFAQEFYDKTKDVFATKAQVGSPLVAATVAGMTDTSKIYVYTGSETGYTAGDWYYYDGSDWVSGGVYNSVAVQTDTTFSVAGMAADSEKVGEELEALDGRLDDIEDDYVTSTELSDAISGSIDDTLTSETKAAQAKAVGDEVGKLKAQLKATTGNELLSGWSENHLYIKLNSEYATVGTPTTAAGNVKYIVIEASAGDQFTISCSGANASRAYGFVGADGGSGNPVLEVADANVTLTEQLVIAPANTAYLVVNDTSLIGSVYSGKLIKADVAELKSDTAVLRTDVDSIMTIPAAYKKVFYLESTGTQYIKLKNAYVATQNSRARIVFQNTVDEATYIFGARSSSSSNGFAVFTARNNSLGVNILRANYGSSGNTNLVSDLDKNVHILDFNKNKIYIDGILNHEFAASTFTTPQQLALFGMMSASSSHYEGKTRIYRFDLYDNDVLVQSLIPCVRVADSVAGLYDAVQGYFYTNDGSGTFIVSDYCSDNNVYFSEELDYVTLRNAIATERSERIAAVENTKELPDYLVDGAKEHIYGVQSKIGVDSIVFTLLTDMHFQSLTTANSAVKLRAFKTMNFVANLGINDFTVDNGDLYSGRTAENDLHVMIEAEKNMSKQRCPHFINHGDHDASQTDVPIPLNKFTATMMPYITRDAVRPSSRNLSRTLGCYYDVPNKTFASLKTRVIVIPNTALTSDVAVRDLFSWLLTDVFTDDVKTGWQFIVISHIPIDIDGLVGRYKATLAETPDTTAVVQFSNYNLGRLVDALNGATTYTYDSLASHTVYYDSDGVITPNTTGTAFTFPMGGYTDTLAQSKDFSAWESKVRLIVSGHNHCDRFNNIVGGVEKDYVVAYSPACCGYPKENTWYVNAFGTEGKTCTWSNLTEAYMIEGTVSEMAFDTYIVNCGTESSLGDNIEKVKFGAGTGGSITIT